MKRLTAVFLLFTVVLAVTGLSLSAQQPVRWRTVISTTGPDEGLVTFKALVSPGWHLYGLDLPDNGPKPTSFDLSGSKDIKFTGKITPKRKPVEVNDPMFGMTLSWWDANIEFTIPFKVTGPAPKLECVISFMTCDGNSCRPPARESISTPIKLKK